MNVDLRAAGEALAERVGIDLVHSHDWLVAGAGEALARGLGVPWLVTVHATEHGRHQGWVDKWPQSHIHGVERRMVRRADGVIACSHFMSRATSRRSSASKPRGCGRFPTASIRPTSRPPETSRGCARASPLRTSALVLLIGRLVYEKGFHTALDALANLVKRPGKVRFLIAGTGTAEAELKAQAQQLGLTAHGTFVGWIGDELLHSLYRIADVCVVPSIYEPFGLVALEAMASGVPDGRRGHGRPAGGRSGRRARRTALPGAILAFAGVHDPQAADRRGAARAPRRGGLRARAALRLGRRGAPDARAL
jgi:glycogen(starch) synthase